MTTALVLIGLGLFLMLIEVFIIPGVGIAGIAGIISTIIGIVLAFNADLMQGWFVLTGTVIISGLLLWKSLKSDTWDRFALHESVESTNRDVAPEVTIDEEGTTITRLNPIGKARFKSGVYEVTAQNELIDEQVRVRVVSLSGNKIIVQTITYAEST